jgi:hypothetical protein
MSRNQLTQRQRTKDNPLLLGNFTSTSIRYLSGSLGPEYKVIGRADTNQNSNGGYGGGTYNHWFQINIEQPAWIIVTKGPPRPQYIQVSAYDLNKNPIEGNSIFDADSIRIDSEGFVYFPYLNTVMHTQSDLYNQFDQIRLDRGDERYYPLSAGSYLICVSSTRNEPINYHVALVIEFPHNQSLFQLEDNDGSMCLQETQTDEFEIILEPGDDAYYSTVHDHSLSEWKTVWAREHQDTDPFPEILVPLTNRP